MVQQPTIPQAASPHDLSLELDHRVVRFAGRPVTSPSRSARLTATGPQVQARTHVIRRVVVLEVTSRLDDAVDELDGAIQLALAEVPRGVLCDLSAVPRGAGPVAVELLATAGRHVRDCSGIPVTVACPADQDDGSSR